MLLQLFNTTCSDFIGRLVEGMTVSLRRFAQDLEEGMVSADLDRQRVHLIAAQASQPLITRALDAFRYGPASLATMQAGLQPCSLQ